MPSFDVVSQVDWPEVQNALDQANREISTRFDFKGSDARVEQAKERLTLFGDDEFKVGQIMDILQTKLAKRGVDVQCLDIKEVKQAPSGKSQQEVLIRHGIDQALAKDLVKKIKAKKLKVQAAVQGDQIRVSGKKRDDLQSAIALLKDEEVDLPLQYVNFRD